TRAPHACRDEGDEMSDELRFELDGGIALLTLDRPQEGNAMTPAMLVALEQAWARVERDPQIRVAVITGAGDRHFCTGASVSALEVGQGSLNNQPHALANRFSPRMCHVTKPVICAVNGLANGGRLHFVADSDIVVPGATAAVMASDGGVGQGPGLGSVGSARRAGLGAALLMGRAGRGYRMPAERACQLGMVDLLEPDPAATRQRARTLAETLLENS